MSNAAAARARGRPARPDRRQEVLRTAARIFSRKGFRQATLSDVAEALGMTRPALYYYAESKDELLAQAGEIARDELDAALKSALAERTGLSQLRRWFVGYATITCEDFGRCFVLTDRSEMNAEEGERSRQSQLRLGRAVSEMIRRGIKDRSIAQCDPTRASQALFAVFNGLARWYRAPYKRSPAQLAEEYLDLFFHGLQRRGGD